MGLISKCCDVYVYHEKLELMGGKAKESGFTHGTSRWKRSLQLFYVSLRTLNGPCYVLTFFFFFQITSVNVTLSTMSLSMWFPFYPVVSQSCCFGGFNKDKVVFRLLFFI